ncbi:MAG: ATP synthase F1 subunit gamma, partial [Alphaproteobacteria bacterium]|nr:ATP synthase F1 subunit gamma [Alphaproteobacteria bacterium]
SSNRGLCGGFNVSIVRWARTRIAELEKEGKSAKLFMIGSKAAGAMRREFSQYMVAEVEEVLTPSPSYEGATQIGGQLIELFDAGEFDVCTVVYNRFVSVLTQIVTPHQLVPFAPQEEDKEKEKEEASTALPLVYDFEASEEEILQEILPRNLYIQILMAMLESFASEQGARMTAMDNATRNANEMIEDLTKVYNRTRQAMITKELIEIISGSEAL